LLAKIPRLVIYLDNLESLLIGPDDPRNDDPAAFGAWRSPALATLWSTLKGYAEATDRLFVVASCRYINDDFGDALIPVNLLPDDAVFRMMEWFPALRRLSVPSRRMLVDRLDGHPRAVEFANDLIQDALSRWGRRYGEWRLPDRPTQEGVAKEWNQLVEPALPRVQQKLRDDLLFDAIWDHVLDDRARRMLYRMTLLRRPWEWDLMRELGEPEEPPDVAEATAERLRSTSLLEQVDLLVRGGDGRPAPVPHYTVHQATAEFIRRRFGDDAPLRLDTHRRVGMYLESQAAASPYIETDIEAGHHLFQAGEYDRAYKLLGSASDWLQNRGRVREGLSLLKPFLAEADDRRVVVRLSEVGLSLLKPFLAEAVPQAMKPELVGQLLGTLGNAYAALGQAERAIGFYEQQLVIVREIGDRRGEGNTLGNLGSAYAELGQAERAIGFCEQALAIARAIGDRRVEGAALGSLGLAYAALGQAERAIGFYEQHLAIARAIGDRRGEGNALGNLGLAYAALGQAERAIGFYEQVLGIFRAIGDRRGEGAALSNLGLAYAALGQAERAIGLLEQALQIGQEIKDPRIIRIASRSLEQWRFRVGMIRHADLGRTCWNVSASSRR